MVIRLDILTRGEDFFVNIRIIELKRTKMSVREINKEDKLRLKCEKCIRCALELVRCLRIPVIEAS